MTRAETWLGMGGVPPEDNTQAYQWERRLHWAMIGIASLSIPSFYIEEFAEGARLRVLGTLIEWFILIAFSAELLWMLSITRQRSQYLVRNWLDVMIIVFTTASLIGAQWQWVPLVRLLRLALVGVLLARVVGSTRKVLRPGGLPYVLAFGFVSLLVAGAGFYWLEPTVHSFGEGLWLAFVTGTTIGYGDFVPTTWPSRLFAVFMVLVGFGILSVATANVAALLIGQDEARLRHEMHRDIRDMRGEIATLISNEERAVIRELHHEIRELRREVAHLRREIEESTNDRTSH